MPPRILDLGLSDYRASLGPRFLHWGPAVPNSEGTLFSLFRSEEGVRALKDLRSLKLDYLAKSVAMLFPEEGQNPGGGQREWVSCYVAGTSRPCS